MTCSAHIIFGTMLLDLDCCVCVRGCTHQTCKNIVILVKLIILATVVILLIIVIPVMLVLLLILVKLVIIVIIVIICDHVRSALCQHCLWKVHSQ